MNRWRTIWRSLTLTPLRCRLGGHYWTLHVEPGRMFLTCFDCPWVSPGWVLPTTRPLASPPSSRAIAARRGLNHAA